MNAIKVELLVCPHGNQALDIGDENGGYRFAGSKCCGRWRTEREWPMSVNELRNAAKEFAALAERLGGADHG